MAKIRWTKQFWACRKAGNWKITEKIANPLEAMKKAWGESIMQDVIFIIGLQPTPIERGGERFDSTYEIVDLGRNRRRAEKTLELLEAGAKAEKKLHEILGRDTVAALVDYFDETKSLVEGARKHFGDRVAKDGLQNVLRYGVDDLVRAETQHSIAKDVLQRVDSAMREVEAKIKAQPGAEATPPEERKAELEQIRRVVLREKAKLGFEELSGVLLTADIDNDYNTWLRQFHVEEHKARARVRRELQTLLDDCDKRDQALAELDRRARIRRTPIDTQLGLEPKPRPIEVVEVPVTDAS